MLYLLNNRSVSRLSRHIQHVNYYHRVKLQWGLLPVLKLPQHHSSSGPTFDVWGWKQDMAALYWDTMPDWISVKARFSFFFFLLCSECSEMSNATSSVASGQHINSDLVAAVQTLSICCDLHSQGPSLRTSDDDFWPPLNKGHPIEKIPWTHWKENPE